MNILMQVRLEQDRQYRVLVTLMRSDRPRQWNFLCNNCGSKVEQLQNLELKMIDDMYDPQNLQNWAIGRHCKGTDKNGLPCKYSYFFHVE